MKIGWLGVSLGTGAIYSLLVPLAALTLLAPLAYGVFSASYLVFAFGVSLQYSVVSEAWARRRNYLQGECEWVSYSSILMALSALVGCLLALLAFVFSAWALELVILSLGAIAGTFRSGSRYFIVAHSHFGRAAVADVMAIIAFGLTFILLAPFPSFFRLSFSWAFANLVAVLVIRKPKFVLAIPTNWIRQRWIDIKPLLMDSLLLDFSAIAVPYLLIGRLGLSDFGVYRGISSAAVPVRLVVDPLRPALGRVTPRAMLRIRSMVFWVVAGTLLGILVAGCLGFLHGVPTLRGSTISLLSLYSVQAGLYTALSFLTMVFYIVARTQASGRALVVARILQTIAAVVLPLLGAYLYGLSAAIWAYVWSTFASFILWFVVVILAQGKRKPL